MRAARSWAAARYDRALGGGHCVSVRVRVRIVISCQISVSVARMHAESCKFSLISKAVQSMAPLLLRTFALALCVPPCGALLHALRPRTPSRAAAIVASEDAPADTPPSGTASSDEELRTYWSTHSAKCATGPHMVHSHTVHLPLGALRSPCTMCGTGGPPRCACST